MKKIIIASLLFACQSSEELEQPVLSDEESGVEDPSPAIPDDQVSGVVQPSATTVDYSINNLKCCTTGDPQTEGGCVDMNPNRTCPTGKTHVGCYPTQNQECWPFDSGALDGGWLYVADGPPYYCAGLSWRVSNGKFVGDDSFSDNCIGDADLQFGTTSCTNDEWPDPYGCAAPGDYTNAHQTYFADGEVGKMYCRAHALSDNGYACVMGEPTGSIEGYTIPAYCLPCPGVIAGDNQDGAWDLVADVENDDIDEDGEFPDSSYSLEEWGASLSCSNTVPGYDGKFITDGTNTCRVVRHECGGILVNTNGVLISENCGNWP